MSANTPDQPLRRPFFIASDEGSVYSENVVAIVEEKTAEEGSKYKGKRVTLLRTNAPNRPEGTANKPYVLGSIGTVRQIFKEHGYDLPDYEYISEKGLQKLDQQRLENLAP